MAFCINLSTLQLSFLISFSLLPSSALPKIIKTGYSALNLQYFFTAGPDEVRAWTIQRGTKAPQAAGKIHTDFEKGFIMAEVNVVIVVYCTMESGLSEVLYYGEWSK